MRYGITGDGVSDNGEQSTDLLIETEETRDKNNMLIHHWSEYLNRYSKNVPVSK